MITIFENRKVKWNGYRGTACDATGNNRDCISLLFVVGLVVEKTKYSSNNNGPNSNYRRVNLQVQKHKYGINMVHLGCFESSLFT